MTSQKSRNSLDIVRCSQKSVLRHSSALVKTSEVVSRDGSKGCVQKSESQSTDELTTFPEDIQRQDLLQYL